MAQATGLKCDVLKTHVAAKKHTIRMWVETDAPDAVELFNKTLDLCPKAAKRAISFLERATTPPPPPLPKEKEEKAPDA